MASTEETLSEREHASYHAAMCLAEAMNEVVRRCSQDFPTETPVEIIKRQQGVRAFAQNALDITADAIDRAGSRR